MKLGIDMPRKQADAVFSIVLERESQTKKWGTQHHPPETWLTILTEEIGEAAQEVLTQRFGEAAKGHGDLREELVHAAAVIVAWIEDIDS